MSLKTSGQPSKVKKRTQAEWSGWRCELGIAASLKGKVYKMLVKPIMYGFETLVGLAKTREVELEVAELNMLRISM